MARTTPQGLIHRELAAAERVEAAAEVQRAVDRPAEVVGARGEPDRGVQAVGGESSEGPARITTAIAALRGASRHRGSECQADAREGGSAPPATPRRTSGITKAELGHLWHRVEEARGLA